MPVDFSSLLADTLSNRGYEVEDASPVEGASGASYPVSMVAHREGERFLVDALASRPVRDEDVQAVASIVDDAELEGAIVLALQGDDHSASGPGADRVEVWGRERIEQAVGGLVVDRHLEAEPDADDIGPSPVDPYAAAESSATQAPADPEPAPAEATPAPSPEPASAGQAAPAAENGASGPTAPEPAQDRAPAETPPERETEAEEVPADETEDTGPGLDEDVNHRDLVDPEDMLERAEQLMERGAVDDGDAEIIVEEDASEPEPGDEPAPAEQPTSEPTEGSPAASPEPAEPEPAEPEPAEPEAPEADDGSDAEILTSEPDAESHERPQPDGEPPEPETATTARDGSEDPTSDRSPPTTGPSPAAAAGPGREDEAFVSGVTIEPQIDETEAELTAQEALFEAEDARLELLPFRVYRYEAHLVGDGHTREEEGRVWVSTQSGAVVPAPSGGRIDEPEVAHERFQGALSARKTEQAAREHLLDTLERRDEVRQDYSESAVIERIRLEPDPERLEVDLLGKAFAPRWRIEGRNGTVFVDAVTGELVNE